MNIVRRGFLKLVAAVAGTAVITRYAEPVIQAIDKRHDWIEDRGDFCIVRVPDFKTFANESIHKPTVFLLGQQAKVRQVAVMGFTNIYAPNGGDFVESLVDSRNMETENERSLIELRGQGITIAGCQLFQGNDFSTISLGQPPSVIQRAW